MMRKIFPAFLFLVSFVTLAQAQKDKSNPQIETAIRRVMSEQAAAWNRGDVEGFMRGYWNSPALVFVSGANVTRGWQPTLDRYKKSYDSRAKMGTLAFSDLEINAVSKDAAIVLGTWSLRRAADQPSGKFTLVFRRFKDGWKIVHDHTS